MKKKFTINDAIGFFAHCADFKKFLLFTVFGLFGFSAIAQTTTTFPSPSSCTSKDLELVSATLTGGDLCNSCSPGTTLTRTLVLAINNKTGSTRTSFAFWGTLVITHADGTTVSTQINRCGGPIPPTGPLPGVYTGANFGTVTYLCGDALRLTNLFLAWTDASPSSTCASLNSSTISPKCGTLPAISINAGVNASFSITNATCTTTGSITVTPFGGQGPYSVLLGGVTHSGISAGASTTFSNLPAATYSGTITDTNGCTFSFSKTVGAPPPPNAPTATVTQPTCSVATGTCTVTSSVSGTTYTLKQNGNIIYTAVNGFFSSVASGTYSLVATIGSCTVAGNNVVINAQPQTPSTPTVCVVQPSLCGPTTGSITILSPLGQGIEYSIDNGTTWQSSASFTNLPAGCVTGIKAKRDGCISGAATCVDSNCSQSSQKVAATVPIEIATDNAVAGFDAFPVPFKDMITLKYKFNYNSPVKIEVFNSRGMSVLTQEDPNGYANKEIAVNFNFNIQKKQIYIVKLTTNKGSTIKKVISEK